jgi:hypothetical protein
MAELTGLNSMVFVGGNLTIAQNAGITSLTGLDNLLSVGGEVIIGRFEAFGGNSALVNLNGLEGLTSVEGSMNIDMNYSLVDITALSGLNSIGENLHVIGNIALGGLNGLGNLATIGNDVTIKYCQTLRSMVGLEGLTSIGGTLDIGLNDSLESLAGLDNINAASIDLLQICGNPSLSACSVQSICDYLLSPGGVTSIANNAPGCNSREEVLAACAVGVQEVSSRQPAVGSFPNPFNSFVTIEYELEEAGEIVLRIYNITGMEVQLLVNERQPSGKHRLLWNAEGLPAGIYFYRLQSGNEVSIGKMIKY